MKTRRSTQLSFRNAFTLVEMLVVISLVLILASITVAFLPTVNERQNASRAADRLQGWLLGAKQMAKRDGVATGIRLQTGTQLPFVGTGAVATWVTDLQYIQQPDPFSGGTVSTSGTTAPYTSITATVDFYGGQTSATLYPVQPGDYIELQGGGLVQLITALPTSSSLTISPGLANAVPATSQYRILRAPRVLPGEPTLQMSQGVAIDLNLGFPIGSSAPFDILFAPSGALVGQSAVNDKIALWVRDVNLNGLQGDMTLVTIYARTGFIAAHLPNISTLIASSTSVSPGTTTMTVSSTTGLATGMYVVLDTGGTEPETQVITSVNAAASQITVGAVAYSHAAPFNVNVDPFAFIRDGRSSGL